VLFRSPAVESVFHTAKRILFNSDGEALLAARLFGPAMWRKGVVVGEGVEQAGPAALDERDGPPTLEAGSYLLYLGRRDRTKNTAFLLQAFDRYRKSHPAARLQLVLAGPGDLPWEEARRPWVHDLGLVSEALKARLLAGCRALVQPSRNESYSRTIMEAWRQARPVVVHDECLATSRAVEVSGGGWAAGSDLQWAEAFAEIEGADEATLRARGVRGLAYAREHADWDKALDRYETALGLSPPAGARARRRRRNDRAIHQVLPGIDYGDAISNQVVFTREVLHDLGYRSEIFAVHIGEPMLDLAKPFSAGAIAPDDALLYHHSIGSELTAHVVRHRGPKVLLYHNITPAHFFVPWDPSFARILEDGRKELHEMASAFPVSAGASIYNAEELREAGFRDPSVAPIFVEPMRWNQAADPQWMTALQDGRTNILFVGRVAPNKCQHDLLAAFREYLSFDPDARLVLVGVWPDGDPYARFLHDEAVRLGVSHHVFMTWRVTDAQLLACYRTAHLFWSMSEHEGFCVPLVEAMWFDVPVLAYRSSAVPETLGSAGMLFTEKGRWPELAALAQLLVEDRELRRKVLEAQRKRRAAFLPEAILPSLLELLGKLSPDLRPEPASADQVATAEITSEYASMIRGQR
jgi:glycosyltransferase involved in cell wall biosynthesis